MLKTHKSKLVASGVAAVVVAGGVAGGLAATSGSDSPPQPTKQELVQWAVQAYGPLGTFKDHLDEVSEAQLSADPQYQLYVGTQLGNDVKDLKKIDPYPGKPDEWKAALNDYADGFAAIKKGDLDTARKELTEGSKHFVKVYDDMQERSKEFNTDLNPGLES